MKFSAVLALAVAIDAGLTLTAAQTLTISTDDCSSCGVGTFCTNSVPECHGPPETGSCFNVTINEYQIGCEDGYDCFDSMCECVIDDTPLATTPTPTTAALTATAAPTATPTPTTAAPTATPTPTTAAPTATPTPTTAAPTATPTPTTAAPTAMTSTSSTGIYRQCPSGTYWQVGATACRGPSYAGECYNPATAKYQNGCAAGFTCINNKCSTIPPATFSPSVCYLKCTESDEYCENGTNACRGPSFVGECFNPSTGYFQDGCGAGYECANNLCVRAY